MISYEGTKALVISTTSHVGGKNPFLGFAYIFVGGISGILGIIFAIKHFVHSPKYVYKLFTVLFIITLFLFVFFDD